MMLIPYIISAVLLLCLIKYLWSRRHLYLISYKLPGPFPLPLLGSALAFLCPTDDIHSRIQAILKSHKHPMKFWLGPKLLVFFTDPNHVEKLLTTSKTQYKHEVYDYLKDLAGEGLVTASGPLYRLHRKLIQPIFNNDFANNCLPIFHEQFGILAERLAIKVEDGTFDIGEYIFHCISDIISESMLGVRLETQKGKNLEVSLAFTKVQDIYFARITKPWLQPDFIFNRTRYRKKYDKHANIVNKFIDKVILSLADSNENKQTDTDFDSASQKIMDISRDQPDSRLSPHLRDHLITLYVASEDTMTLNTSFACLCFGIHPEYQNIAAQEIRDVIGDRTSDITFEDLSKLKYLDMCLKEIMRLFPIGPYILRRTSDNIQIDGVTYTPDCAIVVPIYNIHRNPEYWERPNDFYPDHWLPEAVEKRTNFCYLPFSAGIRSCVGRLFAVPCLKMGLIYILQNYVIEADGTVEGLPLRTDISIRPINGYPVHLKRRVWP